MATTLTGNTRCRVQKRLFKKPLLVLQVEVRHQGYNYGDDSSQSGHYDYLGWRDACTEDLQLEIRLCKQDCNP